jgi:hypothetical protein
VRKRERQRKRAEGELMNTRKEEVSGFWVVRWMDEKWFGV